MWAAAVFAGLASLGWMVERLFDIRTPVDAVVNGFARHGLCTAGGLLVVSFLCNPWVTAWVEKMIRASGPICDSPSDLGRESS